MSIIPDRLSVRDPDYDPDLGALLEIALDGVVQSAVIGYDLCGCKIVRYATDEKDTIIVRDGNAQIETVPGEVTVTIRNNARLQA